MKPGTVVEHKGKKYKAIPNLVQLITGNNSCEGCCFCVPKPYVCKVAKVVEIFRCGSKLTEPRDEQVVFVEIV